jgi:hypothetical protein
MGEKEKTYNMRGGFNVFACLSFTVSGLAGFTDLLYLETEYTPGELTTEEA